MMREYFCLQSSFTWLRDFLVLTRLDSVTLLIRIDSKARELFGDAAITNFDEKGDFNPNAKTTSQISV